MLNLKIVIGSTRPGRAADRVAPWISSAAGQHGAFEVDVIDLRDWQQQARSKGTLPPAIMRLRSAQKGTGK